MFEFLVCLVLASIAVHSVLSSKRAAESKPVRLKGFNLEE